MATKVKHKTLGDAILVDFPNLDGKNTSAKVHREAGIVMIKLSRHRKGYSAGPIKVDIEALTEVGK